MDQPTHPCRKCGAPIDPGSRCKPCKKALRKAQYWANRERALADAAAWQSENRDRHRAANRRYSEAHRDAIRERKAEYRRSNRERLAELRMRPAVRDARREYMRKHYEANRDEYIRRAAEWGAANPERAQESRRDSRRRAMADPNRRARIQEQRRRAESKRRASIAGVAVGNVDAGGVAQRVLYYGGLCWICRDAPWEHIDHVKPLAKGGSHILANLRPACASCNTRKSDTWPFSPEVLRAS